MLDLESPQIKNDSLADQLVDGFIRFFETFFSTFPEYTWDTDETKTRIIIHSFDAFNLETVDKRPRIAVELIEGRWCNLVVDNRAALDFENNTETTSDLVQASIILHCVSKESIEAKVLSSIVFESIRMFRRELRQETGIFELDSVQIGREQRIRTSSQSEVRAVPVTIKVLIQRSYIRFY